jgi:hypothetical protein
MVATDNFGFSVHYFVNNSRIVWSNADTPIFIIATTATTSFASMATAFSVMECGQVRQMLRKQPQNYYCYYYFVECLLVSLSNLYLYEKSY